MNGGCTTLLCVIDGGCPHDIATPKLLSVILVQLSADSHSHWVWPIILSTGKCINHYSTLICTNFFFQVRFPTYIYIFIFWIFFWICFHCYFFHCYFFIYFSLLFFLLLLLFFNSQCLVQSCVMIQMCLSPYMGQLLGTTQWWLGGYPLCTIMWVVNVVGYMC